MKRDRIDIGGTKSKYLNSDSFITNNIRPHGKRGRSMSRRESSVPYATFVITPSYSLPRNCIYTGDRKVSGENIVATLNPHHFLPRSTIRRFGKPTRLKNKDNPRAHTQYKQERKYRKTDTDGAALINRWRGYEKR